VRDDVLDAAQDLRRGLQRQRFGLQRNYHVLAGFEYAANDWSEAGRGVHDHHVAPFASGAEQVTQEGGFRYQFLVEGMVRRLAHRANEHGAKPGKCSWKDDFAELTLT